MAEDRSLKSVARTTRSAPLLGVCFDAVRGALLRTRPPLSDITSRPLAHLDLWCFPVGHISPLSGAARCINWRPVDDAGDPGASWRLTAATVNRPGFLWRGQQAVRVRQKSEVVDRPRNTFPNRAVVRFLRQARGCRAMDQGGQAGGTLDAADPRIITLVFARCPSAQRRIPSGWHASTRERIHTADHADPELEIRPGKMSRRARWFVEAA